MPAPRSTALILLALFLVHEGTPKAPDSYPAMPLALVAHAANSVDSVSSGDLRHMMTGGIKTWPNKSTVVVIEQPDASATQRRLLRRLLGTTPEGYRQQLLATQFRGGELPVIKILNSDETAIKFVWNVPGAFAVVDLRAATGAGGRVKILRIDGKMPGDPGYPLQ